MNYCSNCGVKLDATEHFCHNCGVKIHNDNNDNNNTAKTVVNGQKSKFLAGILAILLGSLGVHNFYLGYNGKGIAQLLLWVFFFGWVSFIWGIVEAVLIFTGKTAFDAKGVPLADNI